MKMDVGGKTYEVDPRVAAALEGEGIRYFTGEIKNGVAVTLVATLKKSDFNFQEIFASMYDTTEGEILLRTGEDYSGLNDFGEGEG